MDTNPRLRISNAYSFDDISIVPGIVTIDPEKVTINFSIGSYKFPIPIIAAAMDAITSPKFIQELSNLGGLGVMNLEGIQTRYNNPNETLKKIIESSPIQTTKVTKFPRSAIQVRPISWVITTVPRHLDTSAGGKPSSIMHLAD